MKPSEIYKENADNCATLAEGEPSKNSPAYKRYRRMEEAWRALAEEQEWLDGKCPRRVKPSRHNEKAARLGRLRRSIQ